MVYNSKPEDTIGFPKAFKYIFGNEAAERFSFYGMRSILVVFMTRYLLNANGEVDPMSEADAKYYFHLFVSANYFFPLLGAFLADWLFGKYRLILALSLAYCFGHLALALDETRLGLSVGLFLIAVGSGGIKPCVSSHLGDQVGERNKHLLGKMMSWFYIAINLGAFVSTLMIPYLLEEYGPSVAFGLPGVLMFIATGVFWAGRNSYAHKPPGGKRFFKEVLDKGNLRTFANMGVVFVFLAVFWALYDQTASAWILQVEDMDRLFWGFEILPSQVQAVNTVFIVGLTPVVTYVCYPFLGRYFRVTAIRKFLLGFGLTFLAFALSALIQSWIDDGQTPSFLWQVGAYLLITLAEILISITMLEYAYVRAPENLKSMSTSFALLSVSLGNLFVAGINAIIASGSIGDLLKGANYYIFFSGLVLIAGLIFAAVAKRLDSELVRPY